MKEKDVDIIGIERGIKEQEAKIIGQVKAGAHLKKLRMEKELSLVSLGKELKVSAAYLSGVEQGVKTMSDYFIRQISNFYNIDETDLFQLLGRIPLLAREQLDEADSLQKLLSEIKSNKKLTDEKKQKLFDQMYSLYKNFPE